jgi:hypothetical protein
MTVLCNSTTTKIVLYSACRLRGPGANLGFRGGSLVLLYTAVLIEGRPCIVDILSARY